MELYWLWFFTDFLKTDQMKEFREQEKFFWCWLFYDFVDWDRVKQIPLMSIWRWLKHWNGSDGVCIEYIFVTSIHIFRSIWEKAPNRHACFEVWVKFYRYIFFYFKNFDQAMWGTVIEYTICVKEKSTIHSRIQFFILFYFIFCHSNCHNSFSKYRQSSDHLDVKPKF